MGAETACPGATIFETFSLLLRLVFELDLLKPPIGISVFGSETRITRPIAPKICSKNDSYEPYLNSKFQVSTLDRFKIIAFSNSGCRIRNFAWKKYRDFRRNASRKFKLQTVGPANSLHALANYSGYNVIFDLI